MNFNADGNTWGRLLALAALVVVVAGLRGIAYGPGCPFCLQFAAPAAAPADAPAPPAEE
jgi:hypothetical protein